MNTFTLEACKIPAAIPWCVEGLELQNEHDNYVITCWSIRQTAARPYSKRGRKPLFFYIKIMPKRCIIFKQTKESLSNLASIGAERTWDGKWTWQVTKDCHSPSRFAGDSTPHQGISTKIK